MLNDQIFSWTLKLQALSEEPISQTESDWGGKQLIIKASNKQFVCPQKIICTLHLCSKIYKHQETCSQSADCKL